MDIIFVASGKTNILKKNRIQVFDWECSKFFQILQADKIYESLRYLISRFCWKKFWVAPWYDTPMPGASILVATRRLIVRCFEVWTFQRLWNLIYIFAALQPRGLLNFRAIGTFHFSILSRDVETSRRLTMIAWSLDEWGSLWCW